MRTINIEELKLQYVNGKYYLVTKGNGSGIYSKVLQDIDQRENNDNNSRRIEFKLYQNAPDPFIKFTDIQFAIPKSGFIKISIFNESGFELEVLLKEFRHGGIHNVKFDGSNLLPGTYFCKAVYTSASEEFIEVKTIRKERVLLLTE